MGAIFSLVGGAMNSVAISNEKYNGDGIDHDALGFEAQRQATEAIDRGKFESSMVRWKGSKLIGEQRVAAANSGVDTQSGTPANVMADTRLMSEHDAQQTTNNAMAEARGHKLEAAQQFGKASLERAKGKKFEEDKALRMVGNFISTTGSTYQSGMASGGG